jgi:enterobactin synthetase component D
LQRPAARPFDVAFHHATHHGVLTAVHLPDSQEPVPDHVLAELPGEEAAYARTLKGYRQPSFVGGRIALRRAADQLGWKVGAILPGDRGAPVLPKGLAGSVSHKRTMAIAMASTTLLGTLGVDLEEYGPARPGIASHVLTVREQEAIASLPEDRRWIAMLVRFSLKESIYKALDPYVRRYVGFHEAEVDLDLQGGAVVGLTLAGGEGPFAVDGRYGWLDGRIFTSARIRPGAGPA